ncbi:MAG: hypothetical protein WBO55_16620 [Rhizobiaceae bacterium]
MGAAAHHRRWIRRIHGALVAKAYGESDLVGARVESTENEIWRSSAARFCMFLPFGRKCALQPKSSAANLTQTAQPT